MLVLARDVHDIDAEHFPSRDTTSVSAFAVAFCPARRMTRLTVTRHAREGDVEVHDELFAPCPIHQDRGLLRKVSA